MKANGIFRNVTPSSKLAMVNTQIGNPNLKYNQGSTYEIYDYIDVTANIGLKQTLRFFEAVNAKAFPYTNIQQNQLQVGEALSIEYIAFTRLSVETKAGVLQLCKQDSLLNVSGLSLSQFSFLLDNSRILKNNSLTRANNLFNPKGATAVNSLFYPDTNLIIPSQISFTAELTIPDNCDVIAEGEVAVWYGIHVFGTAAILNLKSNV